tara:strand:- start:1207 stop:1776 length:570 start_codon:yes stop_codon:yes gene_type:complete
MPTLDDTTTLQKNVAVAGNDSLVISNKDSSASSLVQQVPAAQVLGGFSHAWLFNFDSPTYAVASDSTTVDLLTITSTQFVDNAAVVVTKVFNPSGTATIEVGIEDDDADGYIDGADLKTIAYLRGTGDLLETPAENAAVAVHNPTDGDTLRVTFANGGSQNLSTATTGQVVVLVNIVDTAEYVDLIPAQ